MGAKQQNTLDEYATTYIRLKARKLIGKYGFRESDREDIEQDLTLALLTKLAQFDANKGKFPTFVRLVVERCVVDLIRERKAMARDYRRTESLEELSEEVGDGNLTEPSYDDREQHDLAIDLAEALAALPEDLRKIVEYLRDTPLTEAARRHGCSREVMRGMARQIRRHFAERRLDEYISAHQNGDALRK